MREEWIELRQRMEEHVEGTNQRMFQGTYQFQGMNEHDRSAMMCPHFSAWNKATQMASAEFVGENFAVFEGLIARGDDIDEAALLKDFISELMQNSLDLEVVDGAELAITLTMEDTGTLRWSHNGSPFVGHRPGTGHGDLGALFKIGATTKRLDFRQYGRFGSGFKRWPMHFSNLEISFRTQGARSTIRTVIGGEDRTYLRQPLLEVWSYEEDAEEGNFTEFVFRVTNEDDVVDHGLEWWNRLTENLEGLAQSSSHAINLTMRFPNLDDRTFSIQRERLLNLEAQVHEVLPNNGREIYQITKTVNHEQERRLLIKQPFAHSPIIDAGIAEEVQEISEGWNAEIAGENPYAADDVVGRWYEQVRIELSYTLEEGQARDVDWLRSLASISSLRLGRFGFQRFNLATDTGWNVNSRFWPTEDRRSLIRKLDGPERYDANAELLRACIQDALPAMSIALRSLAPDEWPRFIQDSPMHRDRGNNFERRWGGGEEEDALGELVGDRHGLHPAERLFGGAGFTPFFSVTGDVLEAEVARRIPSTWRIDQNTSLLEWLEDARRRVGEDDFNERFAFLPCNAQGQLQGDEGFPWMHHIPPLDEGDLLAALRRCSLTDRPEMSLDGLLLEEHPAAAGAEWYQPPLPANVRGVISEAPSPEHLRSTSLALLWDLATRGHGLAPPPDEGGGDFRAYLSGVEANRTWARPQGRWALNVRDDAPLGWWVDTLVSYLNLEDGDGIPENGMRGLLQTDLNQTQCSWFVTEADVLRWDDWGEPQAVVLLAKRERRAPADVVCLETFGLWNANKQAGRNEYSTANGGEVVFPGNAHRHCRVNVVPGEGFVPYDAVHTIRTVRREFQEWIQQCQAHEDGNPVPAQLRERRRRILVDRSEGFSLVLVRAPMVEGADDAPDLLGWDSVPKVLLAVRNAISTNQRGLLAHAEQPNEVLRWPNYNRQAVRNSLADNNNPSPWWRHLLSVRADPQLKETGREGSDGPDRNVLATICSLATLCTMASQPDEAVRARLFEVLDESEPSHHRGFVELNGGLRYNRGILNPFEEIMQFNIYDEALPTTFARLQEGQRPPLPDGFAWLPEGGNEDGRNIEGVTFVRLRQGAALRFEQDGRLNVLPSLVEGIRTLIQWALVQPENEQREVLMCSLDVLQSVVDLFPAANPALWLEQAMATNADLGNILRNDEFVHRLQRFDFHQDNEVAAALCAQGAVDHNEEYDRMYNAVRTGQIDPEAFIRFLEQNQTLRPGRFCWHVVDGLFQRGPVAAAEEAHVVWITRDQLVRIFRPQEQARVVGWRPKQGITFLEIPTVVGEAARGSARMLPSMVAEDRLRRPDATLHHVGEQDAEAAPWIALARIVQAWAQRTGRVGIEGASNVRIRMRPENRDALVHETEGELHPIEIGMNGWECTWTTRQGEDLLELSTANLAPSRDRLEASRRLLELLGVTAEDRALEHAGGAVGAWPNPYADLEGEEAWLNRIIDVDWASLDDELERCENFEQLRLLHGQAVEPLTRLLSGQRLGQEQETEVLRQRLNSGPNCAFKNGFYNGIPSMVVNDHPLGRIGGEAAPMMLDLALRHQEHESGREKILEAGLDRYPGARLLLPPNTKRLHESFAQDYALKERTLLHTEAFDLTLELMWNCMQGGDALLTVPEAFVHEGAYLDMRVHRLHLFMMIAFDAALEQVM